jgi:replication factor C large subunit
MKNWTKKYQPKTLNDVVGQQKEIEKIKTSISKTKPLILYGPTGTGKTSIIYAYAKEKNLELLEINASDVRNKNAIESKIGASIKQQSLFSKGKIILIDEIDALSGTKDRGCIQALMKLIPKSGHPLVFTCTNAYSDKLSKLRRKCTMIELEELPRSLILNHIKHIAKEEQLEYDEETISLIAEKSKGDLRAAINDLQGNIVDNKLHIDLDDHRDSKESIKYCLNMIFKSSKLKSTLNVFNKANEDLNECQLWLDENIPLQYDSEELKRAYHYISKADIFKRRIMRWQYWRYMIYVSTFLTAGVALSKNKKARPQISYKRSGRILKLWQAKMRNAKKLSISDKIASATHTSRKRAFKDSFPYIKPLLKDQEIVQELNLSEDEIAWLNK